MCTFSFLFVSFTFTRSTSILTDPELGKSILFKSTFNLEKHEGKWSPFPGFSIKKTDTTLAATDGQKVQIICPLKGTDPWQVIPALLSINPENCVMRLQVDIN